MDVLCHDFSDDCNETGYILPVFVLVKNICTTENTCRVEVDFM